VSDRAEAPPTRVWAVVGRTLLALTGASLLGPGPAEAQGPFPHGEIVPRVSAQADSAQAYALYVPRDYDASRTWPLVILMDPRGRAQIPLRLVAAAAERLGFLVVSSYNTRSDGPAEPNVTALNALLQDVPRRWSVNGERVYLMGFSGTARFAWEAAERLPDNVPGIVGVGAGPVVNDPRRVLLMTLQGLPFDYFGSVGNLDFNFHEVLALETRLEARSIPHRFEIFDGPHAWPPAQVMDRALTWLELRAVARGLAQRPQTWTDSVFVAWHGEARRLEADGQLHAAWRAYRSLVRDFRGVADTDAAEARLAALEGSAQVRRTRAALEQSERRLASWDERYREVSQGLREGELPTLDQLLDRLDVGELLEGASSEEDADEVRSYQRILELLFVRTSFYEPRAYRAAGDLERAILMAQVAEAVKPKHPQACLTLAELYAQLARFDEAVTWIERYAESPTASAATLRSDSLLAPIRGHPGFRAVLERLAGPSH